MKHKPCPFCGYVGVEKLNEGLKTETWICKSCGSSSPVWNQRTNILLRKNISDALANLAEEKWGDMQLSINQTVHTVNGINFAKNKLLEMINAQEV